jgi:Membrane MotB of proton-channel complex MotA/MotB
MHPSHRSAASQSWLVSLSDLMALLLCFFLFHFLATRGPAEAWQDIRAEMRAEFAPFAERDLAQTEHLCASVAPDYWAAQLSQRMGVRVQSLADGVHMPVGADTRQVAQAIEPYASSIDIVAPGNAGIGTAFIQADELYATLHRAGIKAPTRLLVDNDVSYLYLVLRTASGSCAP